MNLGKLTILTLLFLTMLPESARAQTDYFPKGALSDTADSDRFCREWYSKHLKAMKEPSLWELSKDKKAHVYRFVYLRTFDHPIAVRVNLNEDGTGVLVTKVLSGQGGYDPGHIIKNTQRKLSKIEIGNLLQLFTDMDFWKMPSYVLEPDVIGVDGAQWITEGVKEGSYHVVDRWSPEHERDRAFGRLFLFLFAKLRLQYMEVY